MNVDATAYSGWTMSMDFVMDRCLQSITASMLIGLSNIGENAYLFVKFLQCSIFGFCGDTKPASFLYHEHCDLQTVLVT